MTWGEETRIALEKRGYKWEEVKQLEENMEDDIRSNPTLN